MSQYNIGGGEGGNSANTWVTTTSTSGSISLHPSRMTMEFQEPVSPPAPLTEVERLLADVDAVCALAR